MQSTQKPRRSRASYPAITAGLSPDARVKLPQIIGDPASDPPLPGIFPASKTKFYNLIREGYMPEPVKPFPGCKASYWILGDVLRAIRALEAGAQGASYTPPALKARKERRAARGAA